MGSNKDIIKPVSGELIRKEDDDGRDGSGFSDTEIIDSLASNEEEQDDEQEKTTPETDGEV